MLPNFLSSFKSRERSQGITRFENLYEFTVHVNDDSEPKLEVTVHGHLSRKWEGSA